MKVITTNRLNRFWKNGVLPIKNSLANKLNTANVVNNLLTTAAGYALDARQGKALDDKITALNGKLAWKRTRALYILGLDTAYDCVVPSDANEVLVIMAAGASSATTMPDNNKTTLVIPRQTLTGVYTISLFDNMSTYLSIKVNFKTNNKISFTQQNTGSAWTGIRLFAEIYYR